MQENHTLSMSLQTDLKPALLTLSILHKLHMYVVANSGHTVYSFQGEGKLLCMYVCVCFVQTLTVLSCPPCVAAWTLLISTLSRATGSIPSSLIK